MSVWALSDLHLAISVPEKTMEVFGAPWQNYQKKIRENWLQSVAQNDLILIGGDISWAMTSDQAKIDLAWIDELPGTKVMIKGNHDYWWQSISKVQEILPASCHIVQNNSFEWNDLSIGGARLWDTEEYNYNAFIEFKENKLGSQEHPPFENEKIFKRELLRLEMSLKCLNQKAKKRLVMTHYPPIGPALRDSAASQLLEKYNVALCIFGHLHNVKGLQLGQKNGVTYYLTSADFLEFQPTKIL